MNSKKNIIVLIIFFLLSFILVQAQDSNGYVSEKRWSVGMTARAASIHFATEKARSGIFGTAQQFGRINGGNNYPSIYLQKHF